jgi:pilus assembly protein CpaB
MKSKNSGKILILLAMILAVLTAYLSFTYLKRLAGENAPPEEKVQEIWVAKEFIPAREIIVEEMIEVIEVPVSEDLDRYIDNSQDIVGKFTAESILKGEAFPKERLMEDINEELSLRIHGSMRAVSIMVDKNAGVSDMVRPGDRVDIFTYLPELTKNEVIIRPDITKLMLQNIEVLSIRENSSRRFPEDEEVVSPVYDMTIAVPVLEIEKLYLAQNVGSIKLALRPFSGDTFYNSYGTIWEELFLDQEMKHRDFFPEFDIQEDLNKVTEDKLGEYEELVENEESITEDLAVYTVVYGDTLIKISQKYYNDPTKYVEIKRVNKLRTNKILPGQQLRIPKLD